MNAVERIEQVFTSFGDNPQLAARVERIERRLELGDAAH